MRAVPFLSASLAAVLLVPPGVGLHCNGEITTIETGPNTLYIVDRSGGINQWIYLESNGVAGLQSGGHYQCFEDSETCSIINGLTWDSCFHADHDTKIF